jgi:hypothetical protein
MPNFDLSRAMLEQHSVDLLVSLSTGGRPH